MKGLPSMRHVLMILFLLCPGLASAQSVQDQIVSQLTAQGFSRIEVSRTLLGRIKIDARSANLDRELVFNPVTGEILRDYWRDRDDGVASPRVLVPSADDRNDDRSGGRANNSGSGSSGGSGRDDDDSRDDDSGSGGSGSSGSGGDDSGSGRDREDDDRSGDGGGGGDRDDDGKDD
jgi:hypothetical protein